MEPETDQNAMDGGFGYRKHLVDSCQKSQEAYDKAVLALSAGALGVTINFVKDIIGGHPVAMWFLVSGLATPMGHNRHII
jgi:hypothetical protein